MWKRAGGGDKNQSRKAYKVKVDVYKTTEREQ